MQNAKRPFEFLPARATSAHHPLPHQPRDQPAVRIGQRLDDGKMVLAGQVSVRDVGVRKTPGLGQKTGLAHQFGAFGGTHHGVEPQVGARCQERGALGRGLRLIQVQDFVHPRQEQGAQIVEAADGQHPLDTCRDGGGEGGVLAGHARHQMPARRMSGEADGACDLACSFGDGGGD
jgi:ribosomal protein L27